MTVALIGVLRFMMAGRLVACEGLVSLMVIGGRVRVTIVLF